MCSCSIVQKGRNTNDQVKELLDVILPSLEVSSHIYLFTAVLTYLSYFNRKS